MAVCKSRGHESLSHTLHVLWQKLLLRQVCKTFLKPEKKAISLLLDRQLDALYLK